MSLFWFTEFKENKIIAYQQDVNLGCLSQKQADWSLNIKQYPIFLILNVTSIPGIGASGKVNSMFHWAWGELLRQSSSWRRRRMWRRPARIWRHRFLLRRKLQTSGERKMLR